MLGFIFHHGADGFGSGFRISQISDVSNIARVVQEIFWEFLDKSELLLLCNLRLLKDWSPYPTQCETFWTTEELVTLCHWMMCLPDNKILHVERNFLVKPTLVCSSIPPNFVWTFSAFPSMTWDTRMGLSGNGDSPYWMAIMADGSGRRWCWSCWSTGFFLGTLWIETNPHDAFNHRPGLQLSMKKSVWESMLPTHDASTFTQFFAQL